MKIKWINIFAFGILICLGILLLRLSEILENLSYSAQMPDYFNDPTYGAMFLGLICITIVAVVKIFCDR